MVAPPPRTDIRARLDALPDSIPPGTPDDSADPTGWVLVWCVLAGVAYVAGTIVVILIRSIWW